MSGHAYRPHAPFLSCSHRVIFSVCAVRILFLSRRDGLHVHIFHWVDSAFLYMDVCGLLRNIVARVWYIPMSASSY